ncbi:unnamed protein product [Echinostoma caproni]|uniref:Repressor of RNA polymerase III transcription MAF1 homolog n=1 Tax=Echinostoma caproni TaxID=27848 RepID=A0A183B4Z3_9TREM|nr:unnamed protein product [Echinostoma caproni]
MVSEEKKQFKELAARFSGSDTGALRLGSSQTLRGLWELTGQSISPSTYQMSTIQDPQSPPHPNHSSPMTVSNGGKKRSRSDTTSSSDDGITPSSPTPHKSTASSLALKDLFCLMSTLNSCFGPAYDFLTARSDEFCLEPELWVSAYDHSDRYSWLGEQNKVDYFFSVFSR